MTRINESLCNLRRRIPSFFGCLRWIIGACTFLVSFHTFLLISTLKDDYYSNDTISNIDNLLLHFVRTRNAKELGSITEKQYVHKGKDFNATSVTLPVWMMEVPLRTTISTKLDATSKIRAEKRRTKQQDDSIPDYGSIVYHRRDVREIRHNDSEEAAMYREDFMFQLESRGNETSIHYYYHDEELQDVPTRCYRTNWRSKFYSICNNFHDVSFQDNLIQGVLKFRGSGGSRLAWETSSQPSVKKEINARIQEEKNEEVVVKTIRYNQLRDGKVGQVLVNIAHEATIMERLSSSDRIVDIYGYCGSSMLVESMPLEVNDEISTTMKTSQVQKLYKRSEKNWHYPLNNLTSPAKARMALEMAETLAAIHGFEGGVIVHGDVHPLQWLRKTRDGKLKLGDFNNAIILDWNYKKKSYCKISQYFYWTFHAPEEHLGLKKTDEHIDVYAFGFTVWMILTGLSPYWEFDRKNRFAMIRNGTSPVLDEKYTSREYDMIQAKLADIMFECIKFHPEERPDIFQVVEWLRDLEREISEIKLMPGTAIS